MTPAREIPALVRQSITGTISRLKVFRTISGAHRISSVDVFRAFAIISVVVFHFNEFLPYGFWALFFVISGLLVGGLLAKAFARGERISFTRFTSARLQNLALLLCLPYCR